MTAPDASSPGLLTALVRAARARIPLPLPRRRERLAFDAQARAEHERDVAVGQRLAVRCAQRARQRAADPRRSSRPARTAASRRRTFRPPRSPPCRRPVRREISIPARLASGVQIARSDTTTRPRTLRNGHSGSLAPSPGASMRAATFGEPRVPSSVSTAKTCAPRVTATCATGPPTKRRRNAVDEQPQPPGRAPSTRISASTAGTAGLRRAGIPIASPRRTACALAPAGRIVPSSISSGVIGTDKPAIGAMWPALGKPTPRDDVEAAPRVRTVSAASRLPAAGRRGQVEHGARKRERALHAAGALRPRHRVRLQRRVLRLIGYARGERAIGDGCRREQSVRARRDAEERRDRLVRARREPGDGGRRGAQLAADVDVHRRVVWTDRQAAPGVRRVGFDERAPARARGEADADALVAGEHLGGEIAPRMARAADAAHDGLIVRAVAPHRRDGRRAAVQRVAERHAGEIGAVGEAAAGEQRAAAAAQRDPFVHRAAEDRAAQRIGQHAQRDAAFRGADDDGRVGRAEIVHARRRQRRLQRAAFCFARYLQQPRRADAIERDDDAPCRRGGRRRVVAAPYRPARRRTRAWRGGPRDLDDARGRAELHGSHERERAVRARCARRRDVARRCASRYRRPPRLTTASAKSSRDSPFSRTVREPAVTTTVRSSPASCVPSASATALQPKAFATASSGTSGVAPVRCTAIAPSAAPSTRTASSARPCGRPPGGAPACAARCA